MSNSHIRILNATLMFWLGLAAVGQAASFDCNKATTETEKAICADPELGVLDEALGLQWSQMSPIFPKSSQISWLQRRDECKNDFCIRLQLEERLAFLKNVNEIIGDSNLLSCRVGQTIFSVNEDKNGTFILVITDNVIKRIESDWTAVGTGYCITYDYFGYDGSTEILIAETDSCSSGDWPEEDDSIAAVLIGSVYFKCTVLNQ